MVFQLVSPLLDLHLPVVLIHDDLDELIFVEPGKGNHFSEILQHQLVQYVHPNVMGLAAQAVACPFVPAGEILIVGVIVGILVVEIRSAVGAFQKSGKNAFLRVLWRAHFRAAKGFLYGLPLIPGDHRLVDIP